MSSEEQANEFLRELADSLDRRRGQIREVRRVASEMAGTVLESTANQMAIPMFYAHWEGFVREAFQLYLRHVEDLGLLRKEAHPAFLAYSWRPEIRKLKGKTSVENQISSARFFLDALTTPLTFNEEERNIETRGNLRSDVLIELLRWLNLDEASIKEDTGKINALVNRRNEIAHGGRSSPIPLDYVNDTAELVLKLMENIERILQEALAKRTYVRESA